MWFERLFGFSEKSPEQVRANLSVQNGKMFSKLNGKTYQCGQLEVLSLDELKASVPSLSGFNDSISVAEMVADIQVLHQDAENEGALFQVASQLNLLEMVNPNVTPESGVGRYEYDRTQGPACAIACGAGTVYRNYFADLGTQTGQTSELQIDCLDEIGKALENEERLFWRMKNGYALAYQDGLKYIDQLFSRLDKENYEQLKGKLKIGLQWNTEVTLNSCQNLVSQAFCSALPVAYSQIEARFWKTFAVFILQASYEATFYAALLNYQKTGSRKLFLTLVGGGAFGNEVEWIIQAIKHTIHLFRNTPLEVKIVSYGHSNRAVQGLLR